MISSWVANAHEQKRVLSRSVGRQVSVELLTCGRLCFLRCDVEENVSFIGPEGRGDFMRLSGATRFAGKTDVFLYGPGAELWRAPFSEV